MMHLALDRSFTHTEGRWAVPGSWAGRDFPSLAMYEEIALSAERGCLDMLFFGDGTGIPDTWEGSLDAAVRWGIPVAPAGHEPVHRRPLPADPADRVR